MLERVKEILAQFGMGDMGICRFCDVEEHLISCRAERLLPQNAKSVVMVIFPYYIGEIEGSNVSKYAWGRDYHQICGEMLASAVEGFIAAFPGEEFVPFIDNSPIPEVRAASLAGLGVIGDNGLLNSTEFGSFVFIGSIVTSLALAPSDPSGECNHCGKCAGACPTGALSRDGKFNKEICLSHITQKKGCLSEFEGEKIAESGCVWGCDICQNVCPLNADMKKTSIKEFYEHLYPNLTAETVHSIGLEQERAFFWRGKELILRNIDVMPIK